MVKSTYAVTLFAALSMAAPMAPTSNEYTGVEPMRRDGTDNFLGVGADGALNSLTPKQQAEVAEAAKKQKPSILQSLPLIGEFLKGQKRSVEENNLHTRSLTGDLSNLPILGELFGGEQDKNQNTNKPLGNGDAMPGMSTRSYEHAGQNYGQNYGQNAGQNEGQNAGQNWMQNYGQNAGQNKGQNEGQNWLQNYAQNHRRDLIGSLPLIGSLLGGQKSQASKRDNALDEATTRGTITRRDIFDLLKSPQELGEEQQAENAQKAKEGGNGKDEQKPAQDNKKTTENPLKEIFGQSGLGNLVGNANHGVGILPKNGRRDVSVEARDQQPIEGATLPAVLLSSGVLGEISQALASGGLNGAAPAGL